MPPRVLFGPVAAGFAADRLRDCQRAGLCRTFGPGDTWDAIRADWPRGWKPDFVALWLAERPLPSWVWTATVPIVGLATDWDRHWHWHRAVVPRCDLVLTDPPGVRALAAAGFDRARAANLWGLSHNHLDDVPNPATKRDIDVLFVGDLRPETRSERLPWLARVASLANRRVVIATGVADAEYRQMLRRTGIAFNRSARGYDRRTFEALAAGALLFQEANNVEVARLLTSGRDYVAYADDDLERLLERYLADESGRAAIAAGGLARAREFAFDTLWATTAESLSAALPHLADRVRRRPAAPAPLDAVALAWERSTTADVPAYVRGLATVDPAEAAVIFADVLRETSNHLLAALARSEAHLLANQDADSAKAAHTALALIETASGPDATLDLPPYPPGFLRLRTPWERAARASAGDPVGEARAKRELIRGRLHALLAGLTGETAHYYESALATPNAAETRVSLGCALARAGRLADALPHLKRAVADQPFDTIATRVLVTVLNETGHGAQAEAVLVRLRRLHAAAPTVVPAEEWFMGS